MNTIVKTKDLKAVIIFTLKNKVSDFVKYKTFKDKRITIYIYTLMLLYLFNIIEY